MAHASDFPNTPDYSTTQQLGALLDTVDLAAPSNVKFDAVKRWMADRVGLEPRHIGVYWVSKAANFAVRFNQPGVHRDKPLLGIALVPGGQDMKAYLKPAKRAIEDGPFQVMAVCSLADGNWSSEVGYAREGSKIDATAGGLIEAGKVVVVTDPEDEEDEDFRPLERRPPVGFGEAVRPVGWGEYPLDAVFVRNETRTVAEVVRRIKGGRYKLDPDFQRDFVWPVDKQSRLIESCTMRIPLPVLYLAEAKDGSIVVVDGLQRLTTFARFLADDFPLTGLDNVEDGDAVATHPLSGMRFSQLPVSLSERIEDTQLTLYILDAKAPERAKLDIFERVNSGVPLSRQQMRNCLFNGAATQWLKAAAGTPAFLEATGRSLDAKSMRDREAINRFCAFYHLGWRDYRGDMDGFLAQALDDMNEGGEVPLDQLTGAFRQAMELNCHLFGRHAFRKSLASNQNAASRTVINIALFDICSVLIAAPADPEHILSNAVEIRRRLSDLIGDEVFLNAITYSTNSARQVRTRFEMSRDALEELL